MKFAGRRELPDAYGGARGEQISFDGGRHGTVDDGCNAYEERILEARRSWPQASPSDFEKIGKRRYIDKATGTEYVAARGAVMLNIGGEQNRGINCFFIESGRLIFLRRPDFEEPLLGATGHVHAQVVSAASPGPKGPRIL